MFYIYYKEKNEKMKNWKITWGFNKNSGPTQCEFLKAADYESARSEAYVLLESKYHGTPFYVFNVQEN